MLLRTFFKGSEVTIVITHKQRALTKSVHPNYLVDKAHTTKVSPFFLDIPAFDAESLEKKCAFYVCDYGKSPDSAIQITGVRYVASRCVPTFCPQSKQQFTTH